MRSHSGQRGAFLCALFATLLADCGMPFSQVKYDSYYECGLAESRAGNRDGASRCFSRAVTNAQRGRLGPESESASLFEYAKAIGHQCYYDEARTSFQRSLELEEQLAAPRPKMQVVVLVELARLDLDTGQYTEAVHWYEREIPALRKVAVDRADPIAFADELDDFATALEQTGGGARATALRQESAQIRADHPGELPATVAEHYPKDCKKP
ncbi:MAG TPA: tetratricopeptide repeat protein [Myxococcota bacterium]|nr:tetratricopeptide repeat protein [Myxococcota bacterium]